MSNKSMFFCLFVYFVFCCFVVFFGLFLSFFFLVKGMCQISLKYYFLQHISMDFYYKLSYLRVHIVWKKVQYNCIQIDPIMHKATNTCVIARTNGLSHFMDFGFLERKSMLIS